MGTSLELFIICQFPITRNLLYTLIGEDYVVKYSTHFASFNQVLKYWGVIVGLTAIDIITQRSNLNSIIEQSRIF